VAVGGQFRGRTQFCGENRRRAASIRHTLVIAPRVDLGAHLARHGLADLFLDTLPYNAHTTASDALWTGLPLVTCQGRAFAGWVAASLLHAVGMPELVTTSLVDYGALALRLASDPALLTSIRAKLAENRNTHALFDTERFCRHIEAAY
jgi:predicted O-linked N-acetylglucosamine transferase (SPINDLY family)